MEYDIYVNNHGTKCYFKKGTNILHREDGPAIQNIDGYKAWFINGKHHREGSPAVETTEYNIWYINGKSIS